MSNPALRPVPLEPPFVSDANEVAAAWLSLSIGEAKRAANYRRWAAEARTDAERARWTAEAERQEEGSRWHAAKAKQWMDPANG